MYTLDTILADCVGRYIAAPGGRVQLNNLINSRTYADCWGALLSWLTRQYHAGFSVSLAPLGVIVQPPQSQQQRPASAQQQLQQLGAADGPAFAFLTPFVERFGVRPKQCACIYEDALPCTKMNVATLAKVRELLKLSRTLNIVKFVLIFCFIRPWVDIRVRPFLVFLTLKFLTQLHTV
jgi:hypothetical protein